MRKVKAFFHIFSNSALPKAPYYRKLLRTKFSFSLKYFVSLVFLVNLVFLVGYFVQLNPQRLSSTKNALLKSLREYPSDLIISLHENNLSTTAGRPYFFWIDVPNEKTLLAVIDEMATADEISHYQSYVLFTSSAVVLNKEKLQIDGPNSFPYDSPANLTLNKRGVAQFERTIRTMFPLLVSGFMVFAIFIVPLLLTLGYFLYLALVSFLAFLVFKLFFKKHAYKKTLQLSLHAATIPFILEYGLVHLTSSESNRSGSHMFFVLIAIFIFSALYVTYLEKTSRPVARGR